MYSISKNNPPEWCGQNVPAQEPLTAIAQAQEPAKESTIVENGIYSTLKLSTSDLTPVTHLVDDMIGTGLTLLAGAPKSGKSCFSLELAHAVPNNGLFLGRRVMPGTVLYCTFEDTLPRVKERVAQMQLTPSPNCYVTTQKLSLASGLEDFVRTFKHEHPDMVLLILDTLQWVRDSSQKMSYGNDVEELAKLKKLSQELGISILVVHHTRKGTSDTDPLEKVSGTTGLTGTADTILVLSRRTTSSKAKLTCVGKDVGSIELDLSFDSDTLTYRMANEADANIIPPTLARFIKAIIADGGFEGDNCDFGVWLHDCVDPNISVEKMRQLIAFHRGMLDSLGIIVESTRRSKARGVRIDYAK